METFGLLGFLLATLAFIQITIMNRKIKDLEKRIGSRPIELSTEEQQHVKELKMQKQTVQAVKFVREKSGASLIEAKQYVDSL
ncbi:hypothetical protein ACFSY7_00515 [Kurthia populi]|uniref:Ribosomal protein L7/L12 C-terminal domain-containing protein n=1 Tax=Kurthia populi TaxID=1562132 RepID=A0ABW5XVL9_9BACL